MVTDKTTQKTGDTETEKTLQRPQKGIVLIYHQILRT